MTRARGAAFVVIGLALGAITPGAARADEDKSACVTAYQQAQRLKIKQKLIASKSELTTCAKATCPTFIQNDCRDWLRETEAAIPSLLVSVRGPQGVPAADAVVRIDDRPVPDALDREIELDPGVYELVVERTGFQRVRQTVTLTAGEKKHSVLVILVPGSEPPPGDPSDAKPAEPRGVGTATLLFGGLGVIALGAGAAFGVRGLTLRSSLDACRPCANERVDQVNEQFLVADVFSAVGLVSLGVAGYLYLRPSAAAPAAKSQARLSASPSGLFVVGSF